MDKLKKDNPTKQRAIHYYEYFRRYLGKGVAYALALQLVPECKFDVNELEMIYMSHKVNARRKLMVCK